MQDPLYKSTLALAGIAQAATLVKEFAQTGKMDDAAFQASVYSIFQTDPQDVASVYGGIAGVRKGLEQLITAFEPNTIPIQIRYMLTLMRLQKKIFRSEKTLALLTQRLNQTKKQVEYFSLLHPTVIANLADIYLNVIGTFKQRMVIWGNQRILSAPENMEKIRTLLLAGIRSAVLWRQMGGSRIQLIFSRAKIKAMAQKILTELPESVKLE